jgi:hypothetical protein
MTECMCQFCTQEQMILIKVIRSLRYTLPTWLRFRCECQHHTCGETCNQCCVGYNQRRWQPAAWEQSNECEGGCWSRAGGLVHGLSPSLPKDWNWVSLSSWRGWDHVHLGTQVCYYMVVLSHPWGLSSKTPETRDSTKSCMCHVFFLYMHSSDKV